MQIVKSFHVFVIKFAKGTGPLMRALFISVRIGTDLGWPECETWAKEGKRMSRYHKDVSTIGIAKKVFENALNGNVIIPTQPSLQH